MTLSTGGTNAEDETAYDTWGDPFGHMAGFWSPESPVIRREQVPVEVGAAHMGEGFRHQKVVYAKTFMWDYDTMEPRMGTPFHSHYQDEAWRVVTGRGLFRTEAGAFPIGPGDFMYLPGGYPHQIANVSTEEQLVYEVVLVPPVTPECIIVHEPFTESQLDEA